MSSPVPSPDPVNQVAAGPRALPAHDDGAPFVEGVRTEPFPGAAATAASVLAPPAPVDEAAGTGRPQDWAWVEEWRAGREPVPWAHGLTLTFFTSLVVGCAVYVLCSGLSDKPVLSVAVNIIVAAGLAPAVWLSRGLPVLRWVAAGAVLGVAAAWVAAFIFLT